MSRGIKNYQLAEMCGFEKTEISNLCTGRRRPMTDFIAKVCAALKVYPSEIVSFEDIETGSYFLTCQREPLPKEFSGELTYRPFWIMLTRYLDAYNRVNGTKLTHNDIFNKIDPPRRKKGAVPSEEVINKLKTSKYGEDYKSKRKNRTDYSKGLPAVTRVKLRNDRPLNLEVIYEICKYIGCSIDFIMGYK